MANTGKTYSTSERLRMLDEMLALLREARVGIVKADEYQQNLLSDVDGGVNMNIEMVGLLGPSAQVTRVTVLNMLTEYNINAFFAQLILTSSSLGVDVTALDIDVDNGASKATITSVGSGTPSFNSQLAAGDTITITNAENAVNNGTYTLDINSTATVITLDAVISGGVDNTNDKSMVITRIDAA